MRAPSSTRRDPELLEPAWAIPAARVLELLEVDPERGLDAAAVERRRRSFGPNQLRRIERRSTASILVAQLKSFIVGLLAVAAALSATFGQHVEAGAILAVLAINTVIGFVTEMRAVRSMEALRRLGSAQAAVRRAGEVRRVEAQELVPGDIVLLEGGDVVTADLRLIEASRLQADESALTGESVPVGKSVEPVAADAPVAEREPMLFKGTALTRGAAEAVVVATGMSTELGRISALVAEADARETPLEQRLSRLSRRLAWIAIALVAVVAGLGLVSGRPLLLTVETAIALAVAAVPEGLPIVATIALARGMWRMARRNALIEDLSAVETLGSTTLILTDKTGTLTENRMTVTQVAIDDDRVPPRAEEAERLRELLTAAALCTDASLGGPQDERGVGDPMEVALLVAARAIGLERPELVERFPELREEAFDPELKMMATVHGRDGAALVAVKGAPEAVLPICAQVREGGETRPLDEAGRARWTERNAAMAADGLRVLAIASREVADAAAEAYADLTLLGLVGLEDPPRASVTPAIEACRGAGIRVVMATGDQSATARGIARAVGLVAEGDAGPEAVTGADIAKAAAGDAAARARVLEAGVVSRASPEDKLRLLEAYQEAGEVVAMLGDGVNDAPALKKAAIGVAMGKRGSQVAREAAAMVLQDDELGSVTAAIEQGRVIFSNIRKFLVYLISCNASEIFAVGLASLASAPLPILPMQILFLNLVTDVFPALALGVGEGAPGVMQRPPRDPAEPFLTRRHWTRIVLYSAFITAPVLAALAVGHLVLGYDDTQAVTLSFLVLAFGQMLHALNMVEPGSPWLSNEVTRNPWLWAALALCTVLVLVALYVPPIAAVLSLSPPDARGWMVVVAGSLVPLVLGQIARPRA